MAYAAGTQVSAGASRDEIERLLRRFKASNFAYGWSEDQAAVGFSFGGLTIRISVPMPDPDEKRFWYTPGRALKRTEKQAEAAWDDEIKRRWRSLAAVIKAKLIAVEDGISTVEKEFLAFIVLPTGQTLGEWAEPQLARGEALPLLPRPKRELPR